MRKKRQQWSIGDIFCVPTCDGMFAIGQVLAREPELLRSATIALFDERHASFELARSHSAIKASVAYAVLFVTTNHLDSGYWRVIDRQPIAIDPKQNCYEHTRDRGFIGAKVIGANIINEFVNAFYGLAHWDDWMDPNYLDSLLLSDEVKPTGRLSYKDQ